MRRQLTRITVSVAAIVSVAVLWGTLGSVSVAGQGQNTYKAPRNAFGAPDLSGFWQALNTANWDIEEHGTAPSPFPELLGVYLAQPAGLSIVEGGTIPYKPDALKKRDEFRKSRLMHDPLLLDNTSEDKADPEAKCFQGGIPRANYIGFPFQIIQSKDKILMAYEYAGSPRVVHVGDDLTKTRATLLEVNSWNGQSVGKWEGDTLVIDARWFSGPSVWLDRSGNFYSEFGNVVERFTPVSPNHLQYEATITDPETFTRPWKLSMPLYRRMEPNMRLLEFQCIPFAEPFMYGKLAKPKE